MITEKMKLAAANAYMETFMASGGTPHVDAIVNSILEAAEVVRPTPEQARWQPIEEAPKGKVVLTDCGTGVYEERWFLCDSDGSVPKCGDWGREVSDIYPTHWQPLPTMETK